MGELTGAAVAVASFRAGPLRLGIDGSAGMHDFNLDGSAKPRFGASLAMLLLFGL